jgi:hypothetical protein
VHSKFQQTCTARIAVDHTIAKSWKRQYAQSSSTARECSDSSLAGDKPLNASYFFSVLGERLSFGEEIAPPTSKLSPERLRIDMLIFGRQAGIAVFLVTLTLWMQCAGIAVLIDWARASIEQGWPA